MESLPDELLLSIVDSLKFDDILNLCETHPNFSFICKDLPYWKQRLARSVDYSEIKSVCLDHSIFNETENVCPDEIWSKKAERDFGYASYLFDYTIPPEYEYACPNFSPVEKYLNLWILNDATNKGQISYMNYMRDYGDKVVEYYLKRYLYDIDNSMTSKNFHLASILLNDCLGRLFSYIIPRAGIDFTPVHIIIDDELEWFSGGDDIEPSPVGPFYYREYRSSGRTNDILDPFTADNYRRKLEHILNEAIFIVIQTMSTYY